MSTGLDTREKAGLQVIGAGLPRTGTTSLKTALEILGFGPCHHTETVANESYPYPNSKLWQQACLTEDREARRKILRNLYEAGGFRSGCDYPTALFVEDLVDMYPNAKIILGVRSSPQAWRKSVNETIARMRSPSLSYACYLFPNSRINMQPLLRCGQLCERRRHGDVDIFEPKDSVELYHRHNNWVREVVPKEHLLVFNPADGWEPLCKFLGVPEPKDAMGNAVQYPRTNDTAKYGKIVKILFAAGLTSWTLLFGTIYGLIRYLLIPLWTTK